MKNRLDPPTSMHLTFISHKMTMLPLFVVKATNRSAFVKGKMGRIFK